MQSAFDAFARHEDVIAEKLLAFLRSKSAVRIIGHDRVENGNRMPTISFVVNGRHSETIVRQTDKVGIGIRFGDFYARRVIEALGLQERGGVVRVSMAHYNTVEEIDRLITCLDEVIGQA